jgi:hypothetical protein
MSWWDGEFKALDLKEEFMGSSKIKAVILLHIFFFVTALPGLAWEKVSFRHKTAKPFKFKVECRKLKGKLDANPTFKCYDTEGNSENFDPGGDWEEVTIENICFQHKVRDNIRGCIKIQGKQDGIEHVGCMDAKGNLNLFSPDPNKWEVLLADNPDCRRHIIEMDIPRGTIDLQNDESDRSVSGEPGK